MGTAAWVQIDRQARARNGISRIRGIVRGSESVRAAIVRSVGEQSCVADAEITQPFQGAVELLDAGERPDSHAMQRAWHGNLIEARKLDAFGQQDFHAAASIFVIGEN